MNKLLIAFIVLAVLIFLVSYQLGYHQGQHIK